jgi:Ca2+-binding EF-hand superfamily protein
MRKHILLAGTLLWIGALPAHAQMRGGDGRFLEAADANQDGSITRQEYLDHRAQTFGKLDRNGDGFFDQDDVPKRRLRNGGGGGERLAELKQQFDQNNDGRISQSEFANGPTLVFDRADQNQDGVLNPDEIAAAKEAAKAARAKR